MAISEQNLILFDVLKLSVSARGLVEFPPLLRENYSRVSYLFKCYDLREIIDVRVL